MPVVHGFDPPERFVAGTVGQPGQRTFFLQARAGARLVSVALEKQQVAALAERIDELLDEVMASDAREAVIPAVAPLGLDDTEPLEQPIEEEFRAGTMTLSWDPDDERVVDRGLPVHRGRRGHARPGRREDFEEPEPDEVFLVRLTAGTARAFVKRAEQVLERRPARAARSAATRSTPTGTSACGPTASGAGTRDRARRPSTARGRPGAPRPDHAGVQRHLPRRDRRRRRSSTSRSPGSGRCGTSPTAPSPAARWRRTPSPRRSAGTSCPRPGCATGRTAPGWCSAGRSPTRSRRRSRWSRAGEVPAGLAGTSSTALDEHDRDVSLVHEDTAPLRRMAVFDVVVNNADRKGGHVLAMPDGHRYGVDHGVTFHAEHKLRTVLWGWAGEPLTDEEVAGVAPAARRVAGALGETLAGAPDRPRDRRPRPALPPAARPRRAAGARAASGRPSRGRRSDSAAD